jgi:hypothetical protein
MRFVGLPGEAALVFLTSVFLNIYSAIAVIETLSLSSRDIVILASLCCIAHNFFVECLVMKKNGSSLVKMVILRLAAAFATAWVLNFLLPPAFSGAGQAPGELPSLGLDLRSLSTIFLPWLRGTGFMILRIVLIIFGIIFAQRLLEEFGLLEFLGRLTGPLMRVMGLSAKTGYLWIVATVIGVVYGSAILIEEIRSGWLSPPEADLLNHHAAISHAQLEDSLLFVALGAPFLWVALPRFILAVAVVWLVRFRRFIFRRSFRVRIVQG